MKRTDLRRTGWMRRKAPLPRGTCHLGRVPIRPRNPKRAKENHMRAYGGEDRIEWFKHQPCILGCPAPSVNAHVRTGGTSRKADARWIVPACANHHDEMHHGQQTFEAKYGVDLESLAHIYDARYEMHQASTAPRAAQEQPDE